MGHRVRPVKTLAPSDIDLAASLLGCRPAAVRAVCDIEAPGGGFLPDGRPKILFEAHVFYRLTKGAHGRSNISSPTWDRSLYGAAGAHQYDRLEVARQLDNEAALKSASWGMFQILGENHVAAGYDTVESFVDAMHESEGKHLAAFVEFCLHNKIARYLREPPDFASFARRYNGPGYAANGYHTKLAAAYAKHRSARSYDRYKTAKAMQMALMAAGLLDHADGNWGPKSRAAYERFDKGE